MFSLEKISFVTDHIKKELGAVESQVTSGRESLNSNMMLESLKRQPLPQIVLKETQIVNAPQLQKKREKKRGEKENMGAEIVSDAGGLTKRKKIA